MPGSTDRQGHRSQSGTSRKRTGPIKDRQGHTSGTPSSDRTDQRSYASRALDIKTDGPPLRKPYDPYEGTGHPGHSAAQDFASDYYKKFLIGGPNPAAANPKPIATLDDLLASIGNIGAGSIAIPDKAAFLAPFNQAEAATRNVYSQVTPTIDNIYASTGRGMDAQEAQFDSRMAALKAAAGQDQQMAAAGTPVQQHIAVDPQAAVAGLAQQLAGSNAAASAAQASQNKADLAMLNEITAMGNADSNSVQQSNEAVHAGARANADTQLQQALNQIGLGRAKAEGDYASQVAQIQAQNAGLAMDAAKVNLQQRQQAMDEWDRINGDIAKQSGNLFDSQIRALEQQKPDTYSNVMKVLDFAGTDRNEVNYSKAMAGIADQVSSGNIDADEGTSLQEWIQRYYLGGDQIDEQSYLQKGGDPAWLRAQRG